MKLVTGLGLLAAVVLVGCSEGGGAGGNGGGGADVGAGGSSSAEGPSCEPRETPTCPESWYVTSAGRCSAINPAQTPGAACSGEGYASVWECLRACEPDSPCLIPPVPSMYGQCDPEVHTEWCWLSVYCTCRCRDDGNGGGYWECAC